MSELNITTNPKHIYKIHNDFYDLTGFIHLHPGGPDMFYRLKPFSNITSMIYSYHKDPIKLLEILPKYKIILDKNTIDNHPNNVQNNVVYTYDKYLELKKLVYSEMHKNNIPFFWSNSEIAYNLFLGFIYIWFYSYLFYNAATISTSFIFCIVSINIGYGALVFHETSHYTGFKNQKINNIISTYMFSPFITSEDWKFQHNYLHHNFTNTEHDYDFKNKSNTFLRHSNKFAHYYHNYFQHLYAALLFSFALFFFGPIRSFKHRRFNFFLIFIFFYFIGFTHTILLYGITSFIFIFISQLSHIQHECIQINTDLKNDFLCNQVTSAVNYKTDNPLIRIACFGLDIQIEHHLFPNIPHSSLRQIQHVVKSYCNKNNIPYVEYPSVYPTIVNYLKYLYKMRSP
jgi:linoleoyl-CoA desaturase